MRDWDAARIADAAGAELVRRAAGSPERALIDSRVAGHGDLFVALPGTRVDGGEFAAGALAAGAWGVLVTPERARTLLTDESAATGALLAAPDPLRALGALARAWRRALGAQVIAVTGSVGKTSTKELIAAMVGGRRRVVASRANFNTDIGMPLEILAAPAGTEVLVLEAGMRGFGEIATLTAICDPDVGVITTIAAVHLEQVGSLEGVARAKAELIAGMRDGGTAIVPAGEPLLERWLRPDLSTVTFGPGGDVDWAGEPGGEILANGVRVSVELPFSSAHQRRNALAAVAAARAVGVTPHGPVEVVFGAGRGDRVELADGITVFDDCYNASPLSMRAALDDLATQDPARRRVAVLGDMLELGAQEHALHREIGAEAQRAGVELLVTVGPRAAAMTETFEGAAHAAPDAAAAAELAAELVRPGDLVLIKGSNGVGLSVVAPRLRQLVGSAGAAADGGR
ncbi:MAG: UDP-N-acetylmuramoyl-tripeptide--D-alanyl-D-alanine ligase [Solirubrobacteraceae bacterium]|jgi:UDP-N-acetylmuramoyl-tripeptide--D-alanyl-D-alanine ligase|nr:UDP-N-acetylmuramoyl-tripeptide--D-alanyl-D-alanine ligase [Solirubrobacteraceae bacterium]